MKIGFCFSRECHMMDICHLEGERYSQLLTVHVSFGKARYDFVYTVSWQRRCTLQKIINLPPHTFHNIHTILTTYSINSKIISKIMV
jgi:hypothetical protein